MAKVIQALLIGLMVCLSNPSMAQQTAFGFTPSGNTTTMSVTNSSSSITLSSTPQTTVLITNTGSNAAYITNTGTATTSGTPIPAGTSLFFNFAPSSTVSAITASSTTTLTVTKGSGASSITGGGSGTGAASTVDPTTAANWGIGTSNVSGATAPGFTQSVGCVFQTSYVTPGNGQLAPVPCPGSGNVPAVFSSNDPCSQSVKTNLAISFQTTSSTQLIALSGSTKIYVCSVTLVASAATVFSITGGTGTNCGTPAALIGSTSATHGMSVAANGGFTSGGGFGTIAVTGAGSELCIVQSGAGDLVGNLTYIQQ